MSSRVRKRGGEGQSKLKNSKRKGRAWQKRRSREGGGKKVAQSRKTKGRNSLNKQRRDRSLGGPERAGSVQSSQNKGKGGELPSTFWRADMGGKRPEKKKGGLN